jgi:NADH dehydrogenase FAD-containing subunit
LLQTIDVDKKIPFTVVSPSNHFVFTPLLASTAVGTLEFRYGDHEDFKAH